MHVRIPFQLIIYPLRSGLFGCWNTPQHWRCFFALECVCHSLLCSRYLCCVFDSAAVYCITCPIHALSVQPPNFLCHCSLAAALPFVLPLLVTPEIFSPAYSVLDLTLVFVYILLTAGALWRSFCNPCPTFGFVFSVLFCLMLCVTDFSLAGMGGAAPQRLPRHAPAQERVRACVRECACFCSPEPFEDACLGMRM